VAVIGGLFPSVRPVGLESIGTDFRLMCGCYRRRAVASRGLRFWSRPQRHNPKPLRVRYLLTGSHLTCESRNPEGRRFSGVVRQTPAECPPRYALSSRVVPSVLAYCGCHGRVIGSGRPPEVRLGFYPVGKSAREKSKKNPRGSPPRGLPPDCQPTFVISITTRCVTFGLTLSSAAFSCAARRAMRSRMCPKRMPTIGM